MVNNIALVVSKNAELNVLCCYCMLRRVDMRLTSEVTICFVFLGENF